MIPRVTTPSEASKSQDEPNAVSAMLDDVAMMLKTEARREEPERMDRFGYEASVGNCFRAVLRALLGF